MKCQAIKAIVLIAILCVGLPFTVTWANTARPTFHVMPTPKASHARGRLIKLAPGSLRDNIQRIAKDYGWKQVVWALPEDYQWVGYARWRSDSIQHTLRQVLKDYPLQAVLYRGNHILVIRPRTRT